MKYTREYGNLIWTDHAIEKMQERGIPQESALDAFNAPDRSISGKSPGSTEFIKKMENKTITVIAKKNEKGEYIVISAWMDPPLPGTRDAKQEQFYKNYQKAKGLKKFWLTLRSGF
jgi:hypothetical protein